ncbi:MAG TPA: hypothetical protein VK525_09985 [Candidatus Saccharimonadales bacterium]|nr:hypothetical protein [Candidatus Saccharimonadales bacterium]
MKKLSGCEPIRIDWHRLLPGLFLWMALASSVCAQAVAVEVQPSAIPAAVSYSEVQARVILKNPTSSAITGLLLSAMTNDGFEIQIGTQSAKSLGAGQSVVWPIKIKNLNRARIPGTILLDAEYRAATGGTQHAFATVAITAEPDGTTKPVEASIEGNFDAVSQQRPGTGSLLVTNNLSVPVQISVHAHSPENTFVAPDVESFEVAPRSVTAKEIKLNAEKQVTPGTYYVVFELEAQWNLGAAVEKRRLVVSKQATAGVFFESEVLKALGVPSLLVLPGCLVIFTMQLLLTLGIWGLKNDSKLPELTISSPGFWIVAISFSGLFAIGYTWVTHHNYILRYGPEDVRNVWLVSIAFGIAFYLLLAGSTARHRRDYIPTADDTPTTILKKLSKNRLTILRPQVQFKLNGVDLKGYVVERIDEEQTKVWVVPSIITDWGSTAEALKAQEAFQKGIDGRSEPESLAKQLDDAMQRNYVSVRWASQEAVPNPFHLKVEMIANYGQPDVVFGV